MSLCGHCDTLNHWLSPMVITSLVLAMSYGDGSSSLIQGIWGPTVEQATSHTSIWAGENPGS